MIKNMSPWLGQVPLVIGPALGTKMTPLWKNQTPPEDAKPPEGVIGCVFVGGVEPFSRTFIDARIKQAQADGYTDIHELDVPKCDPTKDYFQCQVVGGNPPYKYVWACPSKEAGQPASPEAPASPAKTALVVGGGLLAAGALAFAIFRK